MADELTELVGKDEMERALKGDDVHDAKVKLAEDARDYWKSVSPVGDPETDPHSTEYRESIQVGDDGENVWLGTEVEYAHEIEYGSVNNAEYAPRAKTEAHFG